MSVGYMLVFTDGAHKVCGVDSCPEAVVGSDGVKGVQAWGWGGAVALKGQQEGLLVS